MREGHGELVHRLKIRRLSAGGTDITRAP